jgi:archaellum component FlaG (FlaF/FlaG flagellin family)
MRMRAIACAAAGLLVTAAVAGCGSLGSSVNTTADNTTAVKSAGGRASAAPAVPKKAGLGDTITVTDASGVNLAVTLVKVDPAIQATDGFSTPDSGDQYYAAQFRIKDTGSSAWSDSPSNCTVVKDGAGQTFQSTIVTSISSGPIMTDSANIAPGDSTLGWIVFQIPKGDKVTTVQFTPLSGMGSDTAQWTI